MCNAPGQGEAMLSTGSRAFFGGKPENQQRSAKGKWFSEVSLHGRPLVSVQRSIAVTG
jgi:hypothetical protein